MILVDFLFIFFFFKQKTAYEMRISDWSSDVCSSDLQDRGQETDIAAEQPETAVDIGDERLHELVDDIQILHARDSLKAMDWGRGNRWPREGGAMRSPRRDGARRGTRGAAPPKLWLRRVGLAAAEESARADTGLARALAAPPRRAPFGSTTGARGRRTEGFSACRHRG